MSFVLGLWDAMRPWVYLGALVFPALLGAVWRRWQVRGEDGVEPVRELTRHHIAYLVGGPRGVVLAAVRRLRRTGVLSVTERGLVYAAAGRAVPDRIDRVIVAHADHVLPKSFVVPLRPALRRIARQLEGDGLLVRRRDVWRRMVTVVLLYAGFFVAGLVLVGVAMELYGAAGLELLFILGAVVAVVFVVVGAERSGGHVLTRRGEHALVAAGRRAAPVDKGTASVGEGRSRLRRFGALLTIVALFSRTSVAVADEDDEEFPESWDGGEGAGWFDAVEGGGGDSGGGGDWGGGDSGGGGEGGF